MNLGLVIISLSVTLFLSLISSAYGLYDKDVVTGQQIYGKSLEQWAKTFWNWFATVPPDSERQVNSTTNLNNCIVGSDPNGTMIFLMQIYDATYRTKCDIPSGRAILVPLLIGECDATVEDPRTKTGRIEDLWACAREADEVFESWDVALDNRTLFKRVGGTEVNMPLKNQILVRNSSLFTINIPEGNNFEVDPGRYPAVVDGYYLVLKPLPPGEHTLKYNIIHKKQVPGVNLAYVHGDSTYSLTVK